MDHMLVQMNDELPANYRNASAPHGWLRMKQLPIGRTLASDLIGLGLLKSVIVCRPGSKRGVRLVEAASFEAYLASLPSSLTKLSKRGENALT
jgi:hypothetical protein